MTILTAILILLAVFQKVAPFLEEIEAIAQSESFDSSYLLVLLKAVGITLVGQTTSSLCKDAGESTLAFAVELASKAAILLVSLPVILKVIIAQFFGRGVRAAAILASFYIFNIQAVSPSVILSSIVQGLPGLILQWSIIPLFIFWYNKRGENE